MESRWNIQRGFIKVHVMMVDSKTKKIYAVSVTDDSHGDAPEFKRLLDEALQNIRNSPNVEQSGNLRLEVMALMILEKILSNAKRTMSFQPFQYVKISQVRQMVALHEENKDSFSLAIVR